MIAVSIFILSVRQQNVKRGFGRSSRQSHHILCHLVHRVEGGHRAFIILISLKITALWGNGGEDASPLDAIRLPDLAFSQHKPRRHIANFLLFSRCTQSCSVNSVLKRLRYSHGTRLRYEAIALGHSYAELVLRVSRAAGAFSRPLVPRSRRSCKRQSAHDFRHAGDGAS